MLVKSLVRAMALPPKRAKLRELEDFRRRLPQLSQSALAGVIRIVREDGLPELGDCRNDIRIARDTVVTDMTPYGPMLQHRSLVSKAGVPCVTIDVIHPLAFLWTAAGEDGGFSTFFLNLCRTNPSTAADPWRLCLYTDEVTPGNAMSHNNQRKVWVFYWSILQFGINILSMEDAWFPGCAARSDELKHADAGLSHPGSYGGGMDNLKDISNHV